MVRLSEEFMTLMTPFVLHHYDASRSPLLVTCSLKIVILNGGKNAL